MEELELELLDELLLDEELDDESHFSRFAQLTISQQGETAYQWMQSLSSVYHAQVVQDGWSMAYEE